MRFVNGLFLAAIGYATREVKGTIKGRPVNDPSALILGPDDSGALNSHIPKKDPLCVPPVHYQTALKRLWHRVYNLRIQHPTDDILIYKDDLVSAFRRLRYHPDIAAAYSFAVDSFWILPIGMVFGARDAPSLFCMLSELRSFASANASSLNLSPLSHNMIDAVTFKHPKPLPQHLTPAHKDLINSGIDGSAPGHQPTFVDDTIIAEICPIIREAATNSVLTASLFVGASPLVEEPISVEKFEKIFSHINETLGFVTDSRSLTASYPADKKESLQHLLNSREWKPRSKHPVRVLARILGKVRHVAQILPFGSHLSIRLQLCLSKYIITSIRGVKSIQSIKSKLQSAWNKYATVHISRAAAADLHHLQSILSSSHHYLWHRPLNLLIPVTPHFLGQSDACNTAMGGLSIHLNFQWRLSNDAFSNLPPWINVEPGSPSWHINVHEFIALLINTFFMMHAFIYESSINSSRVPSVAGWVFRLQADNTTALSWIRHLSRSRDPHLSQLCYLYSHITFFFNSLHPARFDRQHLAGSLNALADALSRPKDFPTYTDIFRTYPAIQSIPAYRVHPALISAINACLWRRSTKAILNAVTEALSSSRLPSFRLGAVGWASQTLH